MQGMDPLGLLPSLPRGNDDNFAGFFWNRVLDGEVRDNVFDYGKGLAEGALSVPKGWFNFGYQGTRHLSCDNQAELERKVLGGAAKQLATNGNARKMAWAEVKSQLTNLSNYSSKNIGFIVGRTATSLLARPVGVLAAIGDGASSLNNGGDFVRGIIWGGDI